MNRSPLVVWSRRVLWLAPVVALALWVFWTQANSAQGGEGQPATSVAAVPAPTTPAPPATPAVAIGLSPGSPGDSPFGSDSSLFTPLVQKLGIHDLRVFVRIDGTTDSDLQADEDLVDQAIGKGYGVLVQLADDCRNTCTPPSPDAYTSDVENVVNALPGVHEWSAWNEPDIGGPGRVSPALAATYYADAERVLQGAAGHGSDTLLAGEFASFNASYVAAYAAALKAAGLSTMPTTWSFHPYDDVITHPDFDDAASPATQTGGFTSTQTYALAQFLNRQYAADGQPDPSIWLTESGAWLDCPPSRPECAAGDPLTDGTPAANAIAQEQAAYEFLALANASPGQITRDYYYNWVGDGTGFDSALLDANGVPRPVACVLLGVTPGYCLGSTAAETGDAQASATPVSTAAPTVSTGEPTVGQPVSAVPGTWTLLPTGYSYQWRECTAGACTSIAGATTITYTPTAADVGHSLSVRVVASDPWGAGPPVDSAPTGPTG